MAYIDINPDQLRSVLGSMPPATPFDMLNLLRFRETAEYPAQYANQPVAISGAEAYATYGRHARQHLADIGAEVVVMAESPGTLIGPVDEQWHQVLLVRYPSIEQFVAMVTDPSYEEAAVHRTAALADSRLIVTLTR